MKLKKLQNDFVNAPYDETNRDVLAQIKDGKESKEELLEIYRNNLFVNLRNALRITYPKSYKECDEFIKKNRSRSGNLDDYGKGFADEVEWLKHLSYLAADAKPINLKKLQKLPPEKLFAVKFKLHPSCFLHKNFLIYRQDLEVKVEKISKSESNFLRGMEEGLSLYEIYEKHKINVQSCLAKYLTNGVLNRFSISGFS